MRVYKNSEAINYQLDRYWWRKKAYLTLTGKLLIDLKTQQALPSRLLWEHTYKELQQIQKGVSFDRGKAKVCAEFFIGGNAYAYDEKTTESTASVLIGELKKSVQVFGERYWVKSGPLYSSSPALPFKVLPLSLTNSFGGKDFQLNPDGKGLTQTMQQLWPLPNIECPYELLTSPRQRPSPAGFLPSSLCSPEQLKRLGTIDDAWLKNAWPYLPDDHNPLYWNVAPLDQQQQHYWRGNEQITCVHMHPDKPVQHYALADHRIRAFYQRKGGTPEEMLLNFDTIWLFPHLEQALLIWHGTIVVHDEIASDLDAILMVEENRQTNTLSAESYCALLTEMMIRKPVPLIKPMEKPVTSEKSAEAIKKLAELKAKIAEKKQSVAARIADAKKQLLAAQAALPPEIQAQWAEASSKAVPGPVYDRTLPISDFKKKLLAYAQEQIRADPAAKAQWEKVKATPVKPVDFKALREELLKQKDASLDKAFYEKSLDGLDEVEGVVKRVQQKIANLKSVRRPIGFRSIATALLTKKFENIQLKDHRFKNQHFSGFMFKNCTFKNCHFENCTFSDTTFEQIFLVSTVLQRIRFNHCVIRLLHIKQGEWQAIDCSNSEIANFYIQEGRYEQVIFDQLLLKGGDWQNSHFNACQFKDSTIQQLAIKKCTLKKINWHAVKQSGVYITDSVIEANAFFAGEIKRLSFVDNTISQVDFTDIKASGIAWDSCALTALTIKGSQMHACRFKKCDIKHSQIADSTLHKLVMVDSVIHGLTLAHNDMKSLRLRRLTRVYALQAIAVNLQKASIVDCVFDELHVLHCDLSQSVWQTCAFTHGQLKANKAIFSRFMDGFFINSLLENNDFFTANFKRTRFNNSQILACNLYRVNFYHACSHHLQIKACLLEDPLPIGFWERWRYEGDVSCI